MKKSIIYLTSLIISLSVFAQKDPCYFDRFNKTEHLVKSEKIIQKALAQRAPSSDSLKIIPVVVHIIHNGGSENISDAQVESAIEVINEDYRKLPGTPGDGNGVDTKVQFCLAKKTPDGRCTKGIVRIKSELTNHQTFDRPLLKQLSFWDNKKYLNIYVVKSISGGVLGYSSFPGGPDEEDGIVIEHTSFGRTGTASSSTGRTLTHEVGHWLSLYHTFNGGCGTDICNDGDYVCDTPPAAAPNYGCPAGVNSCSNDNPDLPDQIENYMDYSDGSCQNMLTQGQKERIHAALTTLRTEIWSNNNLTATGCDTNYTPPTVCFAIADFTTLTRDICTGNTVQFIDRSLNNITTWEWTFEGGTPSNSSQQNPLITYDSIGVFDVKLVVTDTYGVKDSLTLPDFITVSLPAKGNTIPFIEDFESGIFPDISRGITLNNPDGGITWELDSLAATSGKYSVKINNLINTNYGTVDEIILPPFDLRSMTNPVLTFNWAYAKSDPNYSDELIVQLSTDCGSTFNQVFYKTGTGLETAPPQTTPFIPDSTQWKSANINLWLYANDSNVIVKIVNVTDGGNNLYIDDINFNGDSLLYSSVENNIKPENFRMYPNPFQDKITIQAAKPVSYISVMDITGKNILQRNFDEPVYQYSLQLQNTLKGIYFIQIIDTEKNIYVKKIIHY